MIVGLWGKVNIGDRLEGCYERTHSERHHLVAIVLREASYEEWLEYRKEEGIDDYHVPNEENGNFYLVSTD